MRLWFATSNCSNEFDRMADAPPPTINRKAFIRRKDSSPAPALPLLKLGPQIAKLAGRILSLLRIAANKDFDQVLCLVQSGKLAIHIDRTCSLEQTADALRCFSEAKAGGKIVIAVDGDR